MAANLDRDIRHGIHDPNILERYCPAPPCALESLYKQCPPQPASSSSAPVWAVGPDDAELRVSPFVGIANKDFENLVGHAPPPSHITVVTWNANLIDSSALALAVETLEATEAWDFICLQEGFDSPAAHDKFETRP